MPQPREDAVGLAPLLPSPRPPADPARAQVWESRIGPEQARQAVEDHLARGRTGNVAGPAPVRVNGPVPESGWPLGAVRCEGEFMVAVGLDDRLVRALVPAAMARQLRRLGLDRTGRPLT